MTILAPAPQPPAPSPQPPQGTRPFGRMDMPFLLLSFFDDIRVARVCIRVRGPISGLPNAFPALHCSGHPSSMVAMGTILTGTPSPQTALTVSVQGAER